MRHRHLLISILGLLEFSVAVPKDPALTDETLLRAYFERSQAQTREILRKRKVKREEFLDQARSGLAGESCLAYEIESGNCSISMAQFNRYLASYFPDSLEFASDEKLALNAAKARRAVIDQMLDRAFLDAYQAEFISHDFRTAEKSNEFRVLYEAIHSPILLKAFPQIRVQVFAASDSDWLATHFEESQSGLLPVTIPAWELPDTAIAFLAKAMPGEWSPIQRVPFGFLTCSWLDYSPFLETLGKMLPLMARIKSRVEMESRREALLALRNHKESCIEEDTFDLFLQLRPVHRRASNDPEPAWKRISSSDLPASIKSLAWWKFMQGRTDTVGPVQSEFGIWTITKQSSDLKPGHSLDSSACLARLEAKLRGQHAITMIRTEWERMSSKMKDNQNSDIRSALLEQISQDGPQPESSYYKMREQWVSRSLRFTRDPRLIGINP